MKKIIGLSLISLFCFNIFGDPTTGSNQETTSESSLDMKSPIEKSLINDLRSFVQQVMQEGEANKEDNASSDEAEQIKKQISELNEKFSQLERQFEQQKLENHQTIIQLQNALRKSANNEMPNIQNSSEIKQQAEITVPSMDIEDQIAQIDDQISDANEQAEALMKKNNQKTGILTAEAKSIQGSIDGIKQRIDNLINSLGNSTQSGNQKLRLQNMKLNLQQNAQKYVNRINAIVADRLNKEQNTSLNNTKIEKKNFDKEAATKLLNVLQDASASKEQKISELKQGVDNFNLRLLSGMHVNQYRSRIGNIYKTINNLINIQNDAQFNRVLKTLIGNISTLLKLIK